MNNERKNRVEDPLVADAYKALAQERAPDHLNKKMLRMAAREGRTPYSRARAWMRPAAWAATIGLSLAIVLELTRLPQIEPDSVNIAVPEKEFADKIDGVAEQRTPAAEPADRVTKDTFAPKDMAVLREAESRAHAQSGPDQAPITPRTDVAVATDQGVSASKTSVDENIAAGNAATERPLAERSLAERSLAERPLAEQPLAEQPLAERDTVEPRAGERRSAEPVAAAASFAVAAEKKALESGYACPAKVRESAESWFACITQLRESGQQVLADSEYDEFQQKFPNFADTDADK